MLLSKRNWLLLLFLTIGCSGFSLRALPAQEHRETYEYTARAVDSSKEEQEEHIRIGLVVGNGEYVHNEIVLGKGYRIERTIESTLQGHFKKGIQKKFDQEAHLLSQESLYVKGQKVIVERKKDNRIKRVSIALPTDKPFAVDASLLYLLRAFPFGTDSIWNIFMVDFYGHSVTVEVRQAAQETVTVPAGTFECYKMEVTVHLWFVRPRIYFWLTASSPHFLVKQVGKRGPFSPRYNTELTQKGDEK